MTHHPSFPFTTHALIRASAGTGKTYALSSQFIALLHQGAQPQTILATTFTRKAAGEILRRVLLRLAHAATDDHASREIAQSIHAPSFNQTDAARLLKALSRELHRVSVSTLDAFFSRLASSFRLELDLPLDPAMVSANDPQAVRARAEGIDAMLAATEPSVMVDMLRRAHHDHINHSVTRAMDQILTGLHEQYRMAPDEAVWSRLPMPHTLDNELLQIAIEQLEPWLEADLGKTYLNAISKSLDAARKGDWTEFLDSGVVKKLLANDERFASKPIPVELQDAYHGLIIHAKADRLRRVAIQTRATWELLREFDSHYDAIRKARRLLTFSDLPLKLARGLLPTSDIGAPGLDALYYRIDGQVRHLLLDEFQDTSPLQWQVLRPLAQEIVDHEGQDRSFFCVGDVKQSIYSWRGGCAELFNQLTNDLMLTDEDQHTLGANRRSSQAVLDVVNTIFTHLPDCLPFQGAAGVLQDVATQWAAVFTDHQAHQHRGGHVKLVTSPPTPVPTIDEDAYSDDPEYNTNDGVEDEGQPAPADSHTVFAAKYIADLTRAHPSRSLGVLVGTNKMVNQLIHLLQKEGVNASGEGGNPVTDEAAVELILAALQLADHPGDSVARYHVQRSALAPIIGLRTFSSEALEVFSQKVRQDLSTQGYASLINAWAGELSLHGNVRSATRLSQLVELAQLYDPLATPRPGDFVDYVKATPVEEPMPAPVRVMTVHKAKGLEFDIVVLPELHRKMASLNRQMCYVYRDLPTQGASAIFRSTNTATRELSPELTQAHEQELARRLGDDLCALYVALTRPHHALHMIIPPLKLKKNGDPGAQGATNLSPASILRSTLGAADQLPPIQETLYSHGDENWDEQMAAPAREQPFVAAQASPSSQQPTLLRIQLPRTGDASRSWRIVAPSSLEAGSRVRVKELLRMESSDGRAYGSLVHAMFQQIQWLDQPPSEDEVTAIAAIARKQVPGAAPVQIDSAVRSFARMLTLPGIRTALSRPVSQEVQGRVELWRERPFAVRLDASLVCGVLDRVVIQRSGAGKPVAAHILDYKTDRLGPGGVQGLVEHYRPQIHAYRRALAVMLDLTESSIFASLLLLGTGESAPVH